MKKFIKFVIMCSVFMLAGLFLSGCMGQSLNLSDNITSSLASIETYFATNVYGQATATDFNTNTSQNYIANENYYVLVATEVEMEITNIKIGEITYAGGVDFSISVGNSNLVTRVPFRIDINNFYISAPLLFLNAGSDGKVMVSFPDQSINSFEITVFTTNLLNIEVTSPNEGTLFAVDNMEYQYTFKSAVPTNSIFVVLKSGETELTNSAIVVVEKVANASLDNQSVAYSYTNPTMPTGETKNGIQLFPGYNNGENYTETTPPDHKLIYNIYVPQVGSVSILINFENTFVA